jgi:hypothetical protein
MTILIGVGLALAALYWWLIGHWFARVVMWFPIAAVLCAGAWYGSVNPAPLAFLLPSFLQEFTSPAAHPGRTLLASAVLGIVAAWFVSGIPIYYHRHRPALVVARRSL